MSRNDPDNKDFTWQVGFFHCILVCLFSDLFSKEYLTVSKCVSSTNPHVIPGMDKEPPQTFPSGRKLTLFLKKTGFVICPAGQLNTSEAEPKVAQVQLVSFSNLIGIQCEKMSQFHSSEWKTYEKNNQSSPSPVSFI